MTTIMTEDTIMDDQQQQQQLMNWLLPLPITQSSLSDIVVAQHQNDETFDQEWNDLRFIPWSFFYLDYHRLKKNIIEASYSSDVIEKQLESEWNKVYDFYSLKKSEIERKMTSSYYNYQKPQANLKESLIMDIHQLYHFAKLNYCGFTRLFMQYPLRQIGSLSTKYDLLLLKKVMINKPFWDHSIGLYDMATRLSYLFVEQQAAAVISTQQQQQQQQMLDDTDITRLAINPHHVNSNDQKECLSAISTHYNNSSINNNNHQLSNKRSTKKYWVHSDNIVEVMLLLSSNNQQWTLQQNQDSFTYYTAAINEFGYPQYSTDPQHGTNTIFESLSPSASTKVTTIYMDSLNLNDYKQRVIAIQQDDTSTTPMTRIRHYTSSSALSKKDGAINEKREYHAIEQKLYSTESNSHYTKKAEKKPHHQQHDQYSRGSEWIQQRVWLKSEHLSSWMNGEYFFSNFFSKPACHYLEHGLPNHHQQLDVKRAYFKLEQEVHDKVKVPVLKVMQNRVLYQSMDINVSISIDTDITMMRFDNSSSSSSSAENDIVRFPFCVLQISQQGETNQDVVSLLRKLDSSPLLEPVHNYSSFLYGMGKLYDVHMFPTWYTKLETEGDGDLYRYTQYRGNLLFTQTPSSSEEEDDDVKNNTKITDSSTTTIQSSTSSSLSGMDTYDNSRTTIATIITCYDDDDDEASPPPPPNIIYSSSCSSSSSLLSPTSNNNNKQKMRRSFDSYCSFDHPTSSRSDPTNCKSCMERYFNEAYHYHHHHQLISDNNNKESVTFLSVMKDALHSIKRSMPYVGSKFEKEPLLIKTTRRYDELALDNNNNESSKSPVTMSCIIISFIILCLFYILFIL